MNELEMTKHEISLIENHYKWSTNLLTGCFYFFIVTSIIFFCFILFNVAELDSRIILLFVTILVSWSLTQFLKSAKSHSSPLLEEELNEGTKIVGEANVTSKVDNSDFDSSYYGLKFNDNRIKMIGVNYNFWKQVEIGDKFYIEQSKIYGFVFRFSHNNTNQIDTVDKSLRL